MKCICCEHFRFDLDDMVKAYLTNSDFVGECLCPKYQDSLIPTIHTTANAVKCDSFKEIPPAKRLRLMHESGETSAGEDLGDQDAFYPYPRTIK